MNAQMRFYTYILVSLLLFPLGTRGQSSAPTLGIPTFETSVEMDGGSLLLLGEAAERGLSGQQGLKIVDRRRMDAVFMAREEVRHEDYLASDREQIAALGADYILLGKVLQRNLRPRQWVGGDGLPRKSVDLSYRLKLSLYKVSNGNMLRSEVVTLSGYTQTQMGEPEMDLPAEAFIGQVERKAADELTPIVRQFVAKSFQGGMQMVDVIHEKGKRITEVLLVTTQDNFRGQELKLYTNEYYLVNGDSLARPIIIGEIRVRSVDGQFLECIVLEGTRAIFDARAEGHEIFAIPAEQKSPWLFRFMSMGLID